MAMPEGKLAPCHAIVARVRPAKEYVVVFPSVIVPVCIAAIGSEDGVISKAPQSVAPFDGRVLLPVPEKSVETSVNGCAAPFTAHDSVLAVIMLKSPAEMLVNSWVRFKFSASEVPVVEIQQ